MRQIFRDPVHNLITFDKRDDRILLDLINAREMQRLRRIKQLGLSYLTYSGAEHSRFGHSLGVAHLMKRMSQQLADIEKNGEESHLQNVKDYTVLAVCAALLHDVGHGPFSHALERFTHKKHEVWTQEIITGKSTEVCQVLTTYDSSFPDKIKQIIARIFKPSFVVKMLSSQFDVDRFDYLLRDSISSGARYGLFDLEWLLQHLRVGRVGDDIEIGVDLDKGLLVAEDFILARRAMYLQVYYHKTTRGAEVLVEKIFKRAADVLKESGDIYAHPSVRKVLTGDILSLEDYLKLDDHVFIYHFHQWSCSEDHILCDLCSRFLNRRLFKSIDLTGLNLSILRMYDKVQKLFDLSERLGFPGEYYITEDRAEHSSYKDYYIFPQKNEANEGESQANDEAREQIYLFDRSLKYKELSNASKIIETLRNKSVISERLYFPEEMRGEVKDIFYNS